MNRIEEAIQKAKAAARAREQEAAAAAPGQVAMPEVRAADGTTGRARQAVDVAAPAPLAHAVPHVEREAEPVRTLSFDRKALVAVGVWPAEAAARRLGDEFRVVKRGILAQFQRAPGPAALRRVVAVASALPGEGKTFSSFHLAMSLALERDTNVLLVDGDVNRPTLTRALGLDGKPGLLDFLESPATSLADVLYRTEVERLWFVPAGTSHATPAEVLGSARMRLFLDEAAARVGGLAVVLDSPPLLPTVESRAIVDAADQTLLVVKANSTPQAAILQALEYLGTERPVQLMLNQRRETRIDQYYYYGYGSNYGQRTGPA